MNVFYCQPCSLSRETHLQVTQMEVDYSVREKEHMNKPPSLDNSNVRLVWKGTTNGECSQKLNLFLCSSLSANLS